MNIRRKILVTVSAALFTLLIILLASSRVANAQVQVAPMTLVRAQFLSSTGVPVAAGCVDFFATGTSTRQAIYADSTGTFQLSNPLTLDAAGEASVWMSNTGYDIVLNTGVANTACSVNEGSQLWRENNKNPFAIINGGSNYIVASGTVDPGSPVAGEFAYRSDIPCFRGFTTIWDCFVELTLSQTLSNKILASPAFTGTATGLVASSPSFTTPSINGTTISGGPATYITLANDITIGTTTGTLTKMLGATAVIASTSDTGGVIGICVAGCGKTGNATIQQSGSVICVADGSFTAGDYLQISSTVGGNCHDIGSAIYPTNGQVIGRAQLTAAGAGTYASVVFGPEIKAVNPVAAQTIYLTSNFTQTGTAFANVAGLSFSASANTKYKVSCDLDYQVTGNGIQIQWMGPAAATFVTYDMNAVLTTGSATVSPGVATAFSTALSGNTTGVTGTNLPIHLSMTLSNGVNPGTVQLQAASTGVAATVTILPGSCGIQQ